MRKLMWIAVGFTTACLLGAYLLPGTALLAAGIFLFLIAVGLFLLSKKLTAKRAAAYLLLGLSLGMIWFQLFASVTLSPVQAADGKVLKISAEVTDYSYSTDYGCASDAKIKLEGKTYKAKLYLNEDLSLEPGDRVQGSFYLRFTGPEGKESSEYHSGTGVFLLCYDRGDVTVDSKNDCSLKHWPARFRRQVLSKVEEIFSEDTEAFAKALLLGDTSDLSYADETALTVSGIVHIVSVSGLHVSILFALLFRVFGSRRVITPVVGSGLLLFVAAITGFSPSIVRACLMNELVLLALMINSEPDGLTSLGFAVLVMLGVNPLGVTSIALQLSVASVFGIVVFSEPVKGWIMALPLWGDVKRGSRLAWFRASLSAAVAVSISASVTTAPLTALHFGTVSIVGLITNLLTLWLVNALFSGIIVAVILGSFWLPAAKILAWVLSWGIRLVLWIAEVLSSFPLAAVYTESVYIVAWLVFAYLALLVLIFVRKKPVWQYCVCTVVTLAVAIGISWLEPRMDDYRITVIDVGQGQCILLQTQGRTYMVDCGGDYDEQTADKAVAVLHSQGIFKLDGMILTHYDRDHVGGASYFLSRVPTETLYLPIGPGAERWEEALIAATDAKIVKVDRDITIDWSGASLEIFASNYRETSNESSLCVLFQKQNYDILITGDRNTAGELDLLIAEQIPQLDALVCGHHGADSSTSELLLERTRPAVVLISVGEGNSYGHPAKAVLERLKEFGCEVRRTDQEGTIIIRG